MKRVDTAVAYPVEVRTEAFSLVVPIEIAEPGRVEYWNALPRMGTGPFKHGDQVAVVLREKLNALCDLAQAWADFSTPGAVKGSMRRMDEALARLRGDGGGA